VTLSDSQRDDLIELIKSTARDKILRTHGRPEIRLREASSDDGAKFRKSHPWWNATATLGSSGSSQPMVPVCLLLRTMAACEGLVEERRGWRTYDSANPRFPVTTRSTSPCQ